MLADNDPMKGWYDRVLQEGNTEKITLLKNFLTFCCGEVHKTREEYRRHCIENGYGSEQSMLALLPTSVS